MVKSGILIAAYTAILIAAAVYAAPKCELGQSNVRWGGMLMQGCR